MIHDHRPYWLKQACRFFERWYASHFVAPGFESIGDGHLLMKPWNIKVHGRHISVGKNAHMVTDGHRKIAFSTWSLNEHQGRITLGDNVLVCPGCRFDSASHIAVGDNCMFAAGAYITDADWHDVFDRTRPVGATRPVTLGDNVWIGHGVTVCKGVTIGDNSVIGAASMVASDIPANVIAAGNPATVIRALDPGRALTTRASLFRDPDRLAREMDQVDRHLLARNTFPGWLRVRLFPARGD